MDHRLIFVFLDGFGLGENSPRNPLFARQGRVFLSPLLKEVPSNHTVIETDTLVMKGIDAICGVPGLPQSATGQTTLFTGVNSAKEIGFHSAAFPGEELVAIIKKENIYSKAAALGKKPVFANAYSPQYFEYVRKKKRRMSVTTHCVLAAGLPFLMLEDLAAGNAVFYDITRSALAKYNLKPSVPVVTAAEAGVHTAGLSRSHDLVVFESFLTDQAGHAKDMTAAIAIADLLEEYLVSVLKSVDGNTSLLVTSDHGNFEDLSTANHTSNPAFFLVAGKAARVFHGIQSITEVTPRILAALAE